MTMQKLMMSLIATSAMSCAAVADSPNVYLPRYRKPVISWEGPYLGLAAGGRWMDPTWSTTSTASGPVFDSTTAYANLPSNAPRGALFAGYNWQNVNALWGIEADVGVSSHKAQVSDIPGTYTPPATGQDRLAIKAGTDGSLRLRTGILVNPGTLFYATGGLALQEVKVTASCATTGSWCLSNFDRNETVAKTLTGWTLGGGAEMLVNIDWFARLEYRYADFGRFEQKFFTAAPPGDEFTGNAKIRTQTISLGLAHKF